ncbi:MAG: hypothetical protein OXE73_09710 [Gammaproteobacteria bacterium]|nr:hypothetical protein [Gammaproteobacteria bacterium]
MTVHGTLRTLFAPVVLLLGACDDTPPTVPEGFAIERFTAILDYLGEDDVMDFWRGPAQANSRGRAFPLGDGYMAHVWRPDFAEAWGIVTDFDEDPDPGCSGRGLRFARCLKRHVDAGETSRIVKEGDTYRARLVVTGRLDRTPGFSPHTPRDGSVWRVGRVRSDRGVGRSPFASPQELDGYAESSRPSWMRALPCPFQRYQPDYADGRRPAAGCRCISPSAFSG